MHSHAELEFNLVLRGRAAYVVDDARYDLGRGSSIWLFPAQQHLLINQSPDFEMWIAVFRRNVAEFPKSSNVYDSLGEAYMKAGQKSHAIENYQRSLELDPKNKNAGEKLKELRQTN